VAPTTTTTVAPNGDPTVALKVLNVSASQHIVPPGVTGGDSSRTFAMEATISNPSSAAKDVSIAITGTASAGFPGYFEAQDYTTAAIFYCTTTNPRVVYYSKSVTAASFVCSGTMPANSSSVITLSAGSAIVSVGSTWSINVAPTPGTAKAVSGTFTA